MIPVLELKTPAVGLAWHEVAALVVDAATALREQPASDVTDLAAIRLSQDGFVVLPNGPAQEWPVLQLARLLRDLLDGLPAPDALRDVATRYLGTAPSESSLDTFLSEVSRFERPDRTAILSQLAARAASVDRDVDGARALAQLAAKVRAEEQAGRPADVAATTARVTRRRSAVALVACAVAASAMVFVSLAYVFAPARPASAGPQPVVARVRAGAAELVASATRVLRPAPAGEPAPAPGTAPEQARATRSRGDRRVARRVPASEPVVTVRWLDPPVVPDAPEMAPIGVPAPADTTVYTSADPDVTPASLLRSPLPSHPPSSVAPEDVGTLELMVTETGRVAHVRLISASKRYQERMLVAAAKTWRFQPAMRDGRPVRYRARVRITL